jgi:glycosyltransferase involved in cell wall biosynthesis
MRIRVDATTLLLQSAGVKTYLHYWLDSLTKAAITHGDQVRTFPPGLIATGELDHTSSTGASAADRLRLRLVHFANLRHNPALNLFLLGDDVFHCSQHTANPPKYKNFTATLFDMSCWTTPQHHTSQNVAATRRYADRILKRCDGIIAISQHARRDAIDILGIPEERIQVIYPGIAEGFFQVTEPEAAQARVKFKLHSPYILFVGCIEPRKNVAGLIQAWQALPEATRREASLVVAGPFGWESGATRTLLTEGARDVKYLGYVAEADLPGLFAGAAAFVYPSFYEGFGLPVAQAMAVGIPVITSDRSCLPEVVGDAGICVNPDATDDLTAAMYNVLTQSSLACRLAGLGRIRARSFQWGSSAAASLAFFHAVAGK